MSSWWYCIQLKDGCHAQERPAGHVLSLPVIYVALCFLQKTVSQRCCLVIICCLIRMWSFLFPKENLIPEWASVHSFETTEQHAYLSYRNTHFCLNVYWKFLLGDLLIFLIYFLLVSHSLRFRIRFCICCLYVGDTEGTSHEAVIFKE